MPQKEAIIDFFQRFEVSQQRYNVNIVERILMESWYIVIVVDEMQLEQKLQHYFFEVRLVHTLIFGLMLQILIVRQLLYLHYLVEHVLKFLPCFVHLFVYINRDVLIWLRYFLKVNSFWKICKCYYSIRYYEFIPMLSNFASWDIIIVAFFTNINESSRI